MPYAIAHNEGHDDAVRVGAYVRRAHTARRKIGTRVRRVKVKEHNVQVHTRYLKLPERRFIGYSPEVGRIIEQCVSDEITVFAETLTQQLQQ